VVVVVGVVVLVVVVVVVVFCLEKFSTSTHTDSNLEVLGYNLEDLHCHVSFKVITAVVMKTLSSKL
jgi:hypothetical protein